MCVVCICARMVCVHTYCVMCMPIPDMHMYIGVSVSVGIHTGMCECVGMCM